MVGVSVRNEGRLGCKSKLCTIAVACGLVLKGRGHSNYWLCHQSMMKVLLAWRESCSNMGLGQFKQCVTNLLQGGTVDLFKSEQDFFLAISVLFYCMVLLF